MFGAACYYRFFFFTDTATTDIYTLSLHDALPICGILREAAVMWLPAPFSPRVVTSLFGCSGRTVRPRSVVEGRRLFGRRRVSVRVGRRTNRSSEEREPRAVIAVASAVGLAVPTSSGDDQMRARRDLAHLSDEALVALLARGHESALGELYDRFGRVAYGLAFRV